MSHPEFFVSSQTCHPEARRAEGTENNARTPPAPRFLQPFGLQDDRSGKIRKIKMTDVTKVSFYPVKKPFFESVV
jgi:hypothetical protein